MLSRIFNILENHFSSKKVAYFISAILLVIGITLRKLLYLDYPLWQDELAVLHHSNKTLIGIFNYTFFKSMHFPFQYLFIKLWFTFVDWTVETSRSFSYVLSIVTPLIPFLFSLKKEDKITGIIALFISGVIFQWGDSATGYALYIFLATILFFSTYAYKNTNKYNLYLIALIIICAFTSLHLLVYSLLIVLVHLYKSRKKIKKINLFFIIVGSFLYLGFFSQTGVFNLIFHPSENGFWTSKIVSFSQVDKYISSYFHNFNFFLILVITSVLLSVNSFKRKKQLDVLTFFVVSSILSISMKLAYGLLYYGMVSRYFIIDFHILTLSAWFLSIDALRSSQKLIKETGYFCIIILVLTNLSQWKKGQFPEFQSIHRLIAFFQNESNRGSLGYAGHNLGWYNVYFRKYDLENKVINIFKNLKKCRTEEGEKSLQAFLKNRNKWIFYLKDNYCKEYINNTYLKSLGFKIINNFDYGHLYLLEVVPLVEDSQ